MRHNNPNGLRWAIRLVIISIAVLLPVKAQQTSGRFAPSADGLTVHDNVLHVTWLADANYPAKQKFGLPIQQSGAMTYANVRKWLTALNASGYLGHKNWTLPATPVTDPDCTVAKGP